MDSNTLSKLLKILGAKPVVVYELHGISMDELGRNTGTLGWFKSEAAARLASNDMGHCYWGITPHKNGYRLPSGEVFLLSGGEVLFQTSARDWLREALQNGGVSGTFALQHLVKEHKFTAPAAKKLLEELQLEVAASRDDWK